jgi:protein disulfide-isomerase A6
MRCLKREATVIPMNSAVKLMIAAIALQCASCLYASNSAVVHLTQANFSKLVSGSDQIWMVEFYAPWCGHCKTLAPEYEKAAKALKGIVNIGAVDMTTDQSVGAPYNIQGFPTIKFFGINKNSPIDYNGARTAQAIVDFVLSQAKSIAQGRLTGGSGSGSGSSSSGGHKTGGSGNGASELTADNFQSTVVNQNKDVFMVMFYAPWCGHCKASMPAWDSAAGEAQDGIKFGKIDCTAHQSICGNYGVQGYPTIKAFVNGKAEDYSGAREKSSFLSFAEGFKDSVKPPKELAHMNSQAVFDDYCIESKGVCLIAFLPNLIDSGSEKRKEFIEQLKAIRSKNSSRPITFLWAQGGDNFDFEESIGLGFGYPSVIAINHGKKKYSIMRAQFTKENVDKFIGDLLLGKVPVYNLRENLPKIKAASSAKTEEL